MRCDLTQLTWQTSGRTRPSLAKDQSLFENILKFTNVSRILVSLQHRTRCWINIRNWFIEPLGKPHNGTETERQDCLRPASEAVGSQMPRR